MLYELRIYHCMPGKLPALLDALRDRDGCAVRETGIQQVGFWTVAIGESTADLYYILKWDSLDDREKNSQPSPRIPPGSPLAPKPRRRPISRVDHQFDSNPNQVLRAEIKDVGFSAIVGG